MELTMEKLTNRLTATIALAALFTLTACTQVPVDNGGGAAGGSGGSSGGATGGGYGGGSGGSTGGGTSGGSGSSANSGSGEDTMQSFVVQLLASSSASKANRVINVFVEEGYRNININTILRNGQSLHRVQIGPFGTRADAQRVLDQMKRRYKKNPYVNSAVVKTIYGK